MKPIRILIALNLIIAACMTDEPELTKQDSYTKIYGKDGESYGRDIIEMPDGGFVIAGIFGETTSTEGQVYSPYILRTDANGNEIKFRNFRISDGYASHVAEFISMYLEVDVDSAFTVKNIAIDAAAFNEIALLNNGNFFLVGELWASFNGIEYPLAFYMIVNGRFEPVRLNFLNNSDIELAGTFERFKTARDPKLIRMDNGDILMLRSNIAKDFYSYFEGYSIYRFNEDGEILSILDIPTKPAFLIPDSWVLKDQDHAVVCGTYLDPGPWDEDNVQAYRDNSIWMQTVNLSTGIVEQGVVFGKGSYNFTWRGGIQRTYNGFVLGDYHADRIGQNWDYNGDGFRNIYGGLWFVDDNLDSLRHRHLTGLEVEQQIARIAKTNDKGYVAGYRRSTGSDFLIVKSDSIGHVEWRRSINVGLEGGEGFTSNNIARIIPTRDGGVAILGGMRYNFMGNRIQLIKLNANGSL